MQTEFSHWLNIRELCYLSSYGQVEYPVSVVVVEVFPEDKDRPPSSTSFDGELPVGIPSRDLEAYLRVGRVRLVTVQSINAPKHRQTYIQTQNQPSLHTYVSYKYNVGLGRKS